MPNSTEDEQIDSLIGYSEGEMYQWTDESKARLRLVLGEIFGWDNKDAANDETSS